MVTLMNQLLKKNISVCEISLSPIQTVLACSFEERIKVLNLAIEGEISFPKVLCE